MSEPKEISPSSNPDADTPENTAIELKNETETESASVSDHQDTSKDKSSSEESPKPDSSETELKSALKSPHQETSKEKSSTDVSSKSNSHELELKSALKSDHQDTSEKTGSTDVSSKSNSGDSKADSRETPKRKSVGFAPEPEEELKEYHQQLKDKEEEMVKENPFNKVPPELAYLQNKASGPKPLPTSSSRLSREPRAKKTEFKELGDLRYSTIKDISVQNKQTELNFNYPDIDLFLPAHKVLIDVKYASLNSYDLAKINKYFYNISNVKVGLGYEFSGIIIKVGSNYKDSPNYKVGTKVVGLVQPLGRKGSLSTSLLIDPTNDIIIPIDDKTLDELDSLDIKLSFNSTNDDGDFTVDSSSSSEIDIPVSSRESEQGPKQEPQQDSKPENDAVSSTRSKLSAFTIDEDLPPLAKLTSFPILYNRAKQALSHVETQITKNKKLNLLINGGDTNLGFTIIQLLNSSLYSKRIDRLNLILVIKESSYKNMANLVSHFTKGKFYDPSKFKQIHLVTFDMVNEDIVLPGESTPINYKKLDFFASEILGSMFEAVPNGEVVTKYNLNDYKLDGIIDIIGSKKFLQRLSVRFSKLDDIALPFKAKLYQDLSLKQLFNGRVKEPFLIKILKPKAQGSSFVSMCNLYVPEPSYSVETLYDYSTNTEGIFNPWSMKWSEGIANSLLGKYNYYEEIELNIKTRWITEGLDLFLKDELKFRIDEYIDWRNNFKKYVKQLKKEDGKIILKVEDF